MAQEQANSLDYLRKEHEIIQTVAEILKSTSQKLSCGGAVPFEDLDKIMSVLEDMDKCHRVEEDQVLFQLKARSSNFDEPIKSLLAEHDNARQIFRNIKTELAKCKESQKPSLLLAGYILDYAESLYEHVKKEEEVFKSKDVGLLTAEDHKNIIARFKRVEQLVLGPVTKGQMAAVVTELHNRLCK